MSRFVQYLLAIGFAALAMGVQIVALPWLAVGALQLSANQVGWVQSAVLLPGVVLMLFGGAFADRPGAIRALPLFYGMLLLSHGVMLWQVGLGLLALSSLLIYALLLGICNAFIQPLRDKVLPIFVAADGNLQTSVVQISLCVYVAQALGVALAGHMDTLGVPLILGLQCSAVFLSALLFFLLLRGKHVSSATAGIAVVTDQPVQKSLISIRDGLAFVFRHRVLKHLMLLVGFNGFMHIGVFVVALPLLARDIYQQDALYFAGLQLVFVAGNIVATLGLLKRGQVDQLGRSVLFCLLYAGIIMMAISAKPTLTGLLMLVFVWGVVAGISASLGKSLLHQQVADEYRGRVLSIYQLALFGAAPLGALACGYAVHVWGALNLFRFGGAVSLVLFVGYLCVRPLWHVSAANTPDP